MSACLETLALKILLIEDDPDLADTLRRGLAASGHVVDLEPDGGDAQAVATERTYDAIVLEGMISGRAGQDVARTLRAHDVRTPIIILTGDVAESSAGSPEAGTDDYLRKPFVFEELEARLRSVARREPALQRDVLRAGDLTMDLVTREVRRGERRIEVSPRETAFLEYFMRNPGALLTRKMLREALWERDRETTSNVLDAYIRRLRRKLCEGGEPELLVTVRGVGYRLRVH